MQSSTFTVKDQAGIEIFVYKWIPESSVKPKAIVHILHGMAEHAARYKHVAQALTDVGYIVYADDHRGHGKTAKDLKIAGYLGEDGGLGTLEAIKQVSDHIRTEFPDLPFFLLGHSWGSYLAQEYMEEWGSSLTGVILSGTTGTQPMKDILMLLGKFILIFKKPESPAKLIDKLAIAPLGKTFDTTVSKNAWLSRDLEVAKVYDADPWCGFMMPTSYFVEMAKAMKRMWNPKNEAKIPKNLPILFFTGGDDPTNEFGKTMQDLIDRYEKLGIEKITSKVYEGGRHEMFNETNKAEVIQDVIDWLNANLP
ncbi:MAG: lysophospholipase [Promethearchaeota archaeon]